LKKEIEDTPEDGKTTHAAPHSPHSTDTTSSSISKGLGKFTSIWKCWFYFPGPHSHRHITSTSKTFTQLINSKKNKLGPSIVAQTYNPSYQGGRDQEDGG
jgi:hypothetical protein